ncbi:MAG: 4Fe-4S binding protein [Candidatus Aenigmarchaeota archaeon]|nr:4Fe-4S binding protein [Candidatus Aenigmarchaeota archaeon]
MPLRINRKKCITCAGCVSVCAPAALELKNEQITLDAKKCTKCRACVTFCPVGALKL